MDTSKEYIEMCESAEEIQASWSVSKSHDGDWIFYRHSLGNGTEEICGAIGANSTADRWLPRQDQLQAMIEPDLKAAHSCHSKEPWFAAELAWQLVLEIDDCEYEWSGGTSPYYQQFQTMEQLWLAFVMKQKYGKVWTGSEWIKE